MPVSDEFLARARDFASQHQGADPLHFQRQLAATGWSRLDWPAPWNPEPLSAEARLAFIHALAEHHCPSPPAGLTVIAGVLLAAGSSEQQSRLLPDIARQPWQWTLARETAWQQLETLPDGYIMAQVPENDGSTLYIYNGPGSKDPGRAEQVGETGLAARYLSNCVSIPWTLKDLLTSLAMLAPLTDAPERHELEIDVMALEQRYLAGASADAIRLSLADCCTRAWHLLFESLGYYALLNPDPVLHGNEPLPFEAERQQLEQLRTLTLPDEMIQKDLLHGETD